MEHKLRVLCAVALAAWCLVQGAESSTELQEGLSPPPSFRVSVACGAEKISKGYDVVVTSKRAQSPKAAWQDRKLFRGLPIVATSRREARLDASGSQHYHIYIVKQDPSRAFPESCKVQVGAGSDENTMSIGSVGVQSASAAKRCWSGSGAKRTECSLWEACELACQDNACEVRSVNKIANLESDLIADTSGLALRDSPQPKPAVITDAQVHEAKQRLFEAESRYSQAHAEAGSALRRVKQRLKGKKTTAVPEEKLLVALKSVNDAVKKELRQVMQRQRELLALQQDQYGQQRAQNQTVLAQRLDRQMRVVAKGRDMQAAYGRRVANLTMSLVVNQKEAQSMSALMGQAEGALKVAQQNQQTFQAEERILQAQVTWLKNQFRLGKERLERLQVDAKKWAVEVQIAPDEFTKKQMKLKLKVAKDMAETSKVRLSGFGAKLKDAKAALAKTAASVQDMKFQVKQAKSSWTNTESHWEQAFRKLQQGEDRRILLQKEEWKSSLQAAETEQKAFATKQANFSDPEPHKAKVSIRRSRFALLNGQKSVRYYQGELFRLGEYNKIEKAKLDTQTTVAAEAGAKLKAANMALAAAQGQALQVAMAVKQANAVEQNTRKVALLRAKDVEALSKKLADATSKVVSAGQGVDPAALKAQSGKSKGKKGKGLQKEDKLTVLRFELHKAQKAAVSAVKEVKGYQQELEELNVKLEKLEQIVAKYKKIKLEETAKSTAATKLLDSVQSRNDATVAEIAAIGAGLKKAGEDVFKAKQSVLLAKRKHKRVVLEAQLAQRRLGAANAMALSNEAGRKKQIVVKQRDDLKDRTLKSKKAVIANADKQASAHAEGHVLLMRLQKLKEHRASLTAAREQANLDLQKASAALTREDDRVGEFRIKVRSTSQAKTEKYYAEKLAKAETAAATLQEKVARLFHEMSVAKDQGMKLALQLTSQESALAKSLAASREAKALQDLESAVLKSAENALVHLQRYIVELDERASSQKRRATQLMLLAADDQLKHDMKAREGEYVASVASLRSAKASGSKYGKELSEVGQQIGSMRHNFTQEVQSEQTAEAQAQHMILGASDAQFVVQQDREKRDTDVQQLHKMKLDLGKEEHIMISSFRREVDLESRKKRIAAISETVAKDRARQAVLLPMFKQELAHAQSLFERQKKITSEERAPSRGTTKSVQILDDALSRALTRMQQSNSAAEGKLRAEEEDKSSALNKVQAKFDHSKKFYDDTNMKLFQVQSNARVSLHALELSYNASLAKALKADAIAGDAIESLSKPTRASQDAQDITEALKAAKAEAARAQNSSEDTIKKALDMVALEELNLLKTRRNDTKKQQVGMVQRAGSRVAVKALDRAHKEMSDVKALTTKLESARDLWKTAVTTTKHSVELAHKIMQAHFALLSDAKAAEKEVQAAFKNKQTWDQEAVINATINKETALNHTMNKLEMEFRQHIASELEPYEISVARKQKKVRLTEKKIQSLDVQLEKLRSELARITAGTESLKSTINHAKADKNLTLNALTITSAEESKAAKALKFAKARALSLERKADLKLEESKEDKTAAYKIQQGLQQEYRERAELEKDASQLEHTEQEDESTVTKKLAAWKQSVSTRKQAPLLLQVALLATSSTAASAKAAQEARTMKTALVALNATVSKQTHFLHQCSESQGELKSEEYGVELLETQAAEFRALYIESKTAAREASMIPNQKVESSEDARKASERASKKVVGQRHKAVLRKLQSFASCKWSSDLGAQVQGLQKQIATAESETLAQHHTKQNMIRRAGKLQVKAAQWASEGKLSVIKTALKMSTDTRMAAQASVKSQQQAVQLLTKLLITEAQRLRKLTLQTLVATSKAASLNSSEFPLVLTPWEQEAGDADNAEAEVEMQLLLKANELLSLAPNLKEAYANVGYSSQEEHQATSALADAELASAATRVKLQQRTTNNLAREDRTALESFSTLTNELLDLKDFAQSRLAEARENRQIQKEKKKAAGKEQALVGKELEILQSNYSSAIVQLNKFRNDGNFWMKKVHAEGANPTPAEKQLPLNFYQEVTEQKGIVAALVKDKIYASKKLQTAGHKALIASAGVTEADVAANNAMKLKTFAAEALSKLRKVSDSTQSRYREAKEAQQKSRMSASQLLKWHAKMIERSKGDSLELRHSVLSMASEFATGLFSVQTALMHGVSTKYRVLKAREKILLRLATYQERKAVELKNGVVKNTEVAKAEKMMKSGASLAEFQHAANKAQGQKAASSLVDRDTAVIAIMDAAQAAAKERAAELHQKQKGRLEVATRFTVAAKVVRAKFPACVARLRQGMVNVKRAEAYAKSTVAALHAVARELKEFKARHPKPLAVSG